MISFRYHIFTIVAIFLAIGLGLLVGNTVVEPNLVRDLTNRTNNLLTNVHDLEAQNGQLLDRIGDFDQASNVLPVLDTGGLAGKEIIVVTHEGVDASVLAETRDALAAAQADLVAVFATTDRLAATDTATLDSLTQVLQMPVGTSPVDLERRTAAELAQRLAVGLAKPADGSVETDVLDELLKAGFLSFPPGFPKVSGSALPQLGGRGEIVVALAGGQTDPAVSPEDFMVPFVDELGRRGASVAAGESSTTGYSFVGLLRAEPGGAMVTVDDLDFSVGGAALVLGLERMLLTGQGGDYGIKAGATGPIPPR